MELSYVTKLRIAVAAAVGVILIGILAWPLARPADPFLPVLSGNITLVSAITLAALAFLAGLAAYFLSWPYGREIGIIAAPAGLAIWAMRCGSVSNMIQLNPSMAHREVLFASLKWEPIFWLVIVLIGFAGVLLGQKILFCPRPEIEKTDDKSRSDKYINAAVAVVGSILISQFCLSIFTQDIRLFDTRLGSVVAQPATGQIVFAVLVSFAIAAFVVKKFLNASCICPIIASGFITAFITTIYIKKDLLQYTAEQWPAVFFPRAISAILPIQIVAIGTLGAIWGYWLAVRYNYWRQNEIWETASKETAKRDFI